MSELLIATVAVVGVVGMPLVCFGIFGLAIWAMVTLENTECGDDE